MIMAISAQDEFVTKLTEVIGLPKYCKWFELRCAVDEAVTIIAEYYPDPEGIETITERFRLEKIDVEDDDDPDESRPG